MAINQNHTFEDLDGVKCAIVEKNVSPLRVPFLKDLLTYNNYTVIVVASPPPKTAAPVAEGETPVAPPETYTVGVTDVSFNPTNAIWGRLLMTEQGDIVTQSYWLQK